MIAVFPTSQSCLTSANILGRVYNKALISKVLGREMTGSGSDALLGRVFNGRGSARDNRPDITDELIPIGAPSVNPAKRIIPRNMIRTNIPMIDVFNTLVESQKLPIFSIAGEPYNQLLARIALQAEVDVIILGGMGLKYDDFLYFKDELSQGGALSKTVMFIHTAADPIVECMMIPDMVLAVAEQFALQDKDVKRFGELMNQSHISLRDDYEVTGIELDTLVEESWKQEGVIGFHGLVQIRLGDDLPGGMHGEDRHAAVDDVHAVEGADVGDGSAAAHVNLAQLGSLPGDVALFHDAAQAGDEFGVGIVGAGLAPAAGKLVVAHAAAEEGGVLLFKGRGVERIKARAHVAAEHAAGSQRAAQVQFGINGGGQVEQLSHGILEVLGNMGGKGCSRFVSI